MGCGVIILLGSLSPGWVGLRDLHIVQQTHAVPVFFNSKTLLPARN